MRARMATTKTSRTGVSNIVKECLGNVGIGFWQFFCLFVCLDKPVEELKTTS